MRAYVLFLFNACLCVAKLSSCSSQSLAISTETCQIMRPVMSSMADLQINKSCVPGLSQWVIAATCGKKLLVQVVDDILDITQTTEQLGKTAGKDLSSDKTTYPALLGLERSKEVAKELIRDAKDALAMYDEAKAAPLTGLADYIISRTN